MSFDALAWAAKVRTKHAADKLVLLGLAECADRETKEAHPSIAALCEFGSLNRKTVITALDRLEAIGMIAPTGRCVGRTGQVKVYVLSLGKNTEKGIVQESQKRDRSQKRNSSGFTLKESQKRDTEPVREPVSPTVATQPTEKRAKARTSFPAPDGCPDQVWIDFLNSPKRKRAGMSETAYAGIVNGVRHCAEHGFPPGRTMAIAVERGWLTVKLEWVEEHERSTTNRNTGPNGRMVGHQPASDGLSPTTRAALRVFGPDPSHPH